MNSDITEVILYTKPTCSQCDTTKRAFGKRNMEEGAEYKAVDMSTDEQALEAVREMGYMQAPVVKVTYADGTVDHWSGFNPTKIDEHFGSLLRKAA